MKKNLNSKLIKQYILNGLYQEPITDDMNWLETQEAKRISVINAREALVRSVAKESGYNFTQIAIAFDEAWKKQNHLGWKNVLNQFDEFVSLLVQVKNAQ